MLISLDWIRDYVDLPADLNPRDLAERLTRTTAEVEGVVEVVVGARGLIVAHVVNVTPLRDTRSLRLALLDVGGGRTVETVTAAPVLPIGSNVVYAPPGSSVAKFGELKTAEVSGQTSAGMILPGDAVGMEMAAQEAVFVGDEMEVGQEIASDLFDDIIIEIDNKSLTHRPDLWGHYGIAREISAIYRVALKPYPVVALEELVDESLSEVPITIADAEACPRYTGLVIEGVPARPGPLWMQLRLGRTGLRPISGLVDLTNYVMTDLGQPMHAFDAAKVTSIEVDWAKEGELIRTLDGMERKLTTKELMIQCGGRSIALAGLMGGLDTEVSEATTALFLESANFDAATIRRTAGRLGLRTDASARFEKSLDPAHTVLAIQRFMHLAKAIYPELTLRSRLSDCYVAPREAITVSVNPRHVARTIGREVTREEASEILHPLGFEVPSSGTEWKVSVPSFRATRDVSIEADVIEELARYIGYGKIAPAMPRVAMRRFAVNALHELEQRTLEHFTTTHRFHEIHGYLWYDTGWLDQLGIDPGPCIELRNPPAVGLHRFRRTLMPGMLAAVVRNRFHFTAFSLIELGSVFEKSGDPSGEFRHVGLVCARRGKRAEGDLVDQLKGAVEVWAWKRFTCPVAFGQATAASDRPWEHPQRTATITIGGVRIGRISVIGPALRRVMDEHLSSWSICWAELRLCDLVKIDHRAEPLGTIPDHPLVEMDFSIVVAATTPYAEVVTKLAEFEHALLKRIRYVGSYEGESLGANRRSLTFRVLVGEDDRTLTESDANAFRGEFETHLRRCDYEIRTG